MLGIAMLSTLYLLYRSLCMDALESFLVRDATFERTSLPFYTT